MTSISITPESVGTFQVRTAAGTDFILELTGDGEFATRKPGMSRPDGHVEPARLPGDFTPLPLRELPAVTLGEPTEFHVIFDGQVQVTDTAPVTSIEEL